jgi:DNA polymerase III delta prime subunit
VETKHIPGPIADNAIYTQLQRAEQMLGHVFEGRLPALILYGPPGIGKSTLGHKVAKAHRERWRPERPGTKLGLVNVLHQHRNGGVVAFDDIDSFWDDGDSLDVLKVALDTKDSRVLSHTVGGSKKNSMKRFEIKCGTVFLSNRNFRDPRDFNKDLWKSGIAAVKDRSMVVGLDFDPLACYEYTGRLATQGGMLSKISIDLKVGSTFRGKNGYPVIITPNNRHRSLTLAEANDVLEHFAKHANRYPSVGPRDLYKFARLRIGADKLQWEGWVEEQLEADPKWKLPADLYQYQIGNEAPKVEEASKVHDSPQVRSCCAAIRMRGARQSG